ncbi:MAG TPA: TdeIII family type II restriction endonuclease [bacterium]|nr:TdeIII family type II restriction endonuclease [bacterium]
MNQDSVVDIFVKIKDTEYYFDITSAKPNMKEFIALKRKLLRWVALRLSQKKTARVFTGLAIPYNPYHPEPYERWTLKGLYDLTEPWKKNFYKLDIILMIRKYLTHCLQSGL